jgi:hypothetical protein
MAVSFLPTEGQTGGCLPGFRVMDVAKGFKRAETDRTIMPFLAYLLKGVN